MKYFITIAFFLLLLLPPHANAGVMDWLFPTVSKEEISACSDKIKEFKAFYTKVRQCNTSDDCVEVVGQCPLTCNMYIHNAFKKILEGQIADIHQTCKKPTNCSSECKAKNPEMVCVNKICRVKK